MDLNKKIEQGMSNPQGYSVARQLGLYHWIQSIVDLGMSLGEYLIVHDEYLSANQIFVGRPDGIITNALVLDTRWLCQQYPPKYDFAPHQDLDYLVVIQTLGRSDKRLVFEVSDDEAIILKELMKMESWESTTVDLTDDAEIHPLIDEVFDDLMIRLKYINTPYKEIDQQLFVPTPKQSSVHYTQQLEFALENSGNKPTVAYRHRKGQVARKLRAHGMTSDIGSIQGVYHQNNKTEWIHMPLIERAFYENRIIAKVQLGNYKICLICRSKTDGVGYNLIVEHDMQLHLMEIDNRGETSFGLLEYEEFTTTEHYTDVQIEIMCDKYWSNSRIPSWLNTFFDIVFELTDDVDLQSVKEIIQMPMNNEVG